jgi:hypothetical protein
MTPLPPAPNEPLSSISESARQWIRIRAHVFPLLDGGKINLPDAASMAGVSQEQLQERYRLHVLTLHETP